MVLSLDFFGSTFVLPLAFRVCELGVELGLDFSTNCPVAVRGQPTPFQLFPVMMARRVSVAEKVLDNVLEPLVDLSTQHECNGVRK